MTLFTLDFVSEIQEIVDNGEAVMHLHAYSEVYGQWVMIGSMHYPAELLPTDSWVHEGRLSFAESSQGREPTVGEQRSVAELRADYVGVKDHGQAKFVLRESDVTDYESRQGLLDIDFDCLYGERSVDFLDQSKGLPPPADDPLWWGACEPYDSWYLTVETEVAPDADEKL